MCTIRVFIKVTGEIFKSSPFTGGIHFFQYLAVCTVRDIFIFSEAASFLSVFF